MYFFINSYFLPTETEWNNLDENVRNFESFSFFKKCILKLTRLSPNIIFNHHNPKKIKLLTRLRLGLIHFCDHKFQHSFQDSLNPICNYGTDIETTARHLLHCSFSSDGRSIFINNIRSISNNILDLNNSKSSEVLSFGNSPMSNTKNAGILNTTIEYIVSSKIFDAPFINSWLV